MKSNGQYCHVGQKVEGADNPNADAGILKIDKARGKRWVNLRVVLQVLDLDRATSAICTLTVRHGRHGVQVVCH